MKYTKLIVKGKVQGVFFRASTREVARHLDLVGYVRNLKDGSVEIVVNGIKTDELYNWSKNGPPESRVDSVERTEVDLGRSYKSFEIKY